MKCQIAAPAQTELSFVNVPFDALTVLDQVRNCLISLGPAFDERNYGCRSFRDFLGCLAHRVAAVGSWGGDVTLALTDGALPGPADGGR
ncbi:hypothetical protein CLV40_12951 [Actinokineospora auranticolor]|uniref:Uncharacterized protein n=1 Tax=Actinokineospora auranticolor TaxID=155976 RepID=A0A2S6GDL3_9PSEU|nr:hypothetical protein CLV40_12951 [Actinokineospora auranticolor]